MPPRWVVGDIVCIYLLPSEYFGGVDMLVTADLGTLIAPQCSVQPTLSQAPQKTIHAVLEAANFARGEVEVR